MQCKWAFLCLSLLSGIYVSAAIQTHYVTIPKHWAGQNMWIKPQSSSLYDENDQYKEHIPCVVVVVVCLFGLNVAFNNCSVILRRCLVATGSSLLTFIVLRHWSITPQTLDTIPHTVTLSRHCLDQSQLFPVSLDARRGAACTILKDVGMSRPGSNSWPQVSRSGHSADWATGTGTPLCAF